MGGARSGREALTEPIGEPSACCDTIILVTPTDPPQAPIPRGELAPGSKIGKYRLLGRIGQGAMGTVYLAEDPFIARRVAIKLMRAQSEEGTARFLNEARTVGSLSHPNIVLIHEFGFEGELPYLVMELVEGESLDHWLKQPRDLAARLRVIRGLCRALEYAHEHGVLHRDLKPTNVLVRADGEPKLVDFGIARSEDSGLTATGVLLGTPQYLAPELLAGNPCSTRSDLYGLSLVAYELFGGRNPFVADSVAVCLTRVLEVTPPALDPVATGTPVSLARAILAGLAKDPAKRPAGPRDLLAVIERLPSLPDREPATLRLEVDDATAARRRRRALAALLVLGVSAGALAASWWAWRGERPATLETPAPQPAPAVGRERENPSAPATPAKVEDPAPRTDAPVPVVQERPAPPVTKPVASEERAPVPADDAASEPEPLPATADAPPSAALVLVPPLPRPEPSEAASPPPETPRPQATPVIPPTAEPSPPAPPPAPQLVRVVPATLRQGHAAELHITGEHLDPNWTPVLRRGTRSTAALRVLRVEWRGAGELVLSLLVVDDAPLGGYSLLLVSPSGESTNVLHLEVDL